MSSRVLLIFLTGLVVVNAFGSASDESKEQRRLRWTDQTIKVFISSSLFESNSSIKPDSDVSGAVLRALQKWEHFANIEFQVAYSEISAISPRGPSGDGISLITVAPETENLLAFAGTSRNGSGSTRIFFDRRGSITEADIVLNPTQLFTTDKTPGTFDLEAVLTHEVGHLLGLTHSADASSIMFDGVPRNGAFETNSEKISLSSDDKVKIQRAYGPRIAVEGCCTKVTGRLTGSTAKASANFLIWVQDARTGALVEIINQVAEKPFEFESLVRGSYELIAQDKSNYPTAAVSSGVRDVQSDRNIILNARKKSTAFDLYFLGTGGDLSTRAVPVRRGNTYRLVIAGPGLLDPELQFSTTSPKIVIDTLKSESGTIINGIAHRAFLLTIDETVPIGQYSIYAEDRMGSRRYFAGGIAVN